MYCLNNFLCTYCLLQLLLCKKIFHTCFLVISWHGWAVQLLEQPDHMHPLLRIQIDIISIFLCVHLYNHIFLTFGSQSLALSIVIWNSSDYVYVPVYITNILKEFQRYYLIISIINFYLCVKTLTCILLH